MKVSHNTLIYILISCSNLLKSTDSLDFEKNACPNLKLYHVAASSNKCYYNPDVLSDVPSMTKRHGYDIQTHSVTTDDGYILTLFNILPRGKQAQNFTVFIQHGITASSGSWVDIGTRSMAFNFADKGYTVWLGNVRGSTYSNKHQTLSVDDPEYWKFSLDTIAEKDMSTQLTYVFQKSEKKIIYIGHSMGTTLFCMFTSAYSEKANKLLQAAFLLAPVVYINDVPVIEAIKIPALLLLDTLETLGVRGLFYQETEIHQILTETYKKTPEICYSLINIIFGKTLQFASDDLLLYYSYWPGGTSIYEFKQYLQIASSKRFQQFDYGSMENLKEYGTIVPPVYNLSKLTVPVCLFYGENDSLYNKKNIGRLYEEIGSTKKCMYSTPFENSDKKFNHIDFVYSQYIVENLYKLMFNALHNFKKN